MAVSANRLELLQIADAVAREKSIDRTIVITAISEPAYKPTKAELTAIRKGEAAIARGDYVSLAEFLNVDRPRRKAGAKTARKVSR